MKQSRRTTTQEIQERGHSSETNERTRQYIREVTTSNGHHKDGVRALSRKPSLAREIIASRGAVAEDIEQNAWPTAMAGAKRRLLPRGSSKGSTRAAREERHGPVFIRPPPGRVEFLNSTQTVVPCDVQGVPRPEVWWWRVGSQGPAPDIPGLRHVRVQDGALVFSPFRAEDFRQDIHAAVYRCGARNSVGSIVSGDVHVRAACQNHLPEDIKDCKLLSQEKNKWGKANGLEEGKGVVRELLYATE
ncbi:hypothetical protein MTO96_028578 [Rhipicephalus appendiculatus]